MFRPGGKGGEESVLVTDEMEPLVAASRVQGRGETRQARVETQGSLSKHLVCKGLTPHVNPLMWGHGRACGEDEKKRPREGR